MNKPDISSKKDTKKLIRSIFQAAILLILLSIIIRAMFSLVTYKPYEESNITANDNGFIAISYFGVDRNGNNYLVSTKNLEMQLKSLSQHGYQTITQKDIQDYYENGTPLPDKALFLMFEDGRRDTSIFAQKIIEKYNYKATIMSYAEKFSNDEGKFLVEKDLKDLEKTTFWELGTNGYRLSYINVFDRYDNYLGELTSPTFQNVSPYLGRNYNHYLMDFIRDDDNLPKESRSQMNDRIRADYAFMEELYTDGVGYLPKTYVIMHANTGAFGNNDKVSAVNRECIEELFTINFNREGFSYNDLDSSIYDLTRMQPQPHWSTNHLLMRIKDDTKEDFQFVEGTSDNRKHWDILKGAAEFTDDKVIITTEAKSQGLIQLKDCDNLRNFYLNVDVTGNKVGEQTIYVRADNALNSYIAVKIVDNKLAISQKENGGEKELFQIDLQEVDAAEKISLEEDEKAALVREYETLMTYAKSDFEKETYALALAEAKKINTAAVEEGAEEYVAELGNSEYGNRKLKFSLMENHLTVWIDEKMVADSLTVSHMESGGIFLKSGWSDNGFSERNLSDDVYDGIFEKLYLSEDENGTKILFDQRLNGLEKFKKQVTNITEKVVNWFVENL